MASKLLKVLDDIEEGRKKCIQAFKNNNIAITDNTSIDQMGSLLEANLNSDNAYTLSTRYYDNPFDDPYLPKLDPYIKSYEDVFYNAENITDEDGSIWCPVALYLFTVDEDMPTTVIEVSQYVNIDSSGIRLGYSRTIKVKLNDGTIYTVSLNNPIQHTWDSTKDLIDPNTGKHYKYIIGYCRENTTSSGIVNSAFDNKTNKIHVKGVYVNMHYIDTGNNSPLILGADKQNIEYIRYYADIKNANKTDKYYSVPYAYAKYIVIDNLDNKPGGGYRNIFRALVLINRCKPIANEIKVSTDVRYLETTSIKISQLTDSQKNIPSLKYLIITDMDTQSTLRDTSGVIPPFIKDPNILSAQLTKLSSDLIRGGCLFKNLSFPNITEAANGWFELYAFIDTLDLSGVVEYNTEQYLVNVNARVIKLNNVKIITANIPISASCCSLELKSLPTIDVTLFNNEHHSLYELDLSSCSNVSKIQFNYVTSLRVLKLGNNIKGNVNLSYLNKLQFDCVLDILNKLATLDPDETYTIKLPTSVKYFLSDSDIAIATNKGWVVS